MILEITGDHAAIAEWAHAYGAYVSSQTLGCARVICHPADSQDLQISAHIWGLTVRVVPSLNDLQRALVLTRRAEDTALKAAVRFAETLDTRTLALAERAIDCALIANQQLTEMESECT